MGARYQQLWLEDRSEIAHLQAEGYLRRQIVGALSRAPLTIIHDPRTLFIGAIFLIGVIG